MFKNKLRVLKSVILIIFLLIISSIFIIYQYGSRALSGKMPDGVYWPPCTYYDFKGGRCKENGVQKILSSRGNQEWLYKDGKLDGVSRFFYPNGNLRLESTYKDDMFIFDKHYDDNGKLKDGVYTKYYKNSKKVYLKEVFKDGVIQKFTSYSKNGRISREGNYKDGQLEGDFNIYYDSGQLASHAVFEAGKVVGVQNSYYENGNLREEEFFKDGNSVRIKKYDKDGHLISDDKIEPKHPDNSIE